jgi:hypothetical protein
VDFASSGELAQAFLEMAWDFKPLGRSRGSNTDKPVLPRLFKTSAAS